MGVQYVCDIQSCVIGRYNEKEKYFFFKKTISTTQYNTYFVSRGMSSFVFCSEVFNVE